jgi:alpha-ribazole phosphatase
MNTVKIYLVRHGEILIDSEKRYIGQIDLPLNENGRKQAARLRDQLSRVKLDRIICSDLARAVTTASIIGEKQESQLEVKKELREIDMGVWDGMTFASVRRSYPGEYEKRGSDLINYRPPGGESFAQCAARVLPVIDDALQVTVGKILIVGHAGVNRLIICRALGLPMTGMFDIKQDYGCLNILQVAQGCWKVEVLNNQLYK